VWGLEREGLRRVRDEGEGGYAVKDESLDLCEIVLHDEREREDETVAWKIIR
jgi:hypothetical protein